MRSIPGQIHVFGSGYGVEEKYADVSESSHSQYVIRNRSQAHQDSNYRDSQDESGMIDILD